MKTRIKSIGSTRKITRAMQMVSAAKMRKSQQAVFNSRAYANLAWKLIEKLSEVTPIKHPLMEAYPKAKKIGLVLLTTNRGLVGSLNINLLAKIKEIDSKNKDLQTTEQSAEILTEIITHGKKGQNVAARLKKTIIADFPKQDRVVTVEEIYPIAQFLSEMYASGQYKKIVLVFNEFVSTLQQKATVKQLFPFINQTQTVDPEPEGDSEVETANFETDDWVKEPSKVIAGLNTIVQTDSDNTEKMVDFIKDRTVRENYTTYGEILFEPTPKIVIEHLIPRIIESQVYETILEAEASEHSARMVMMKNATDAAGDLISDYTLTYNQLRQGKITTELAEITAGRIALE